MVEGAIDGKIISPAFRLSRAGRGWELCLTSDRDKCAFDTMLVVTDANFLSIGNSAVPAFEDSKVAADGARWEVEEEDGVVKGGLVMTGAVTGIIASGGEWRRGES